MKYQSLLAGACIPALALAYPGLMGASKEEMLIEYAKREAAASQQLENRDLLSGVVSGLTGTVNSLLSTVQGILGSVASSVDPDDLRPQPGYVFQAPKSTDSRGPCPGLNLLANYGYLPRDGHVTLGEIINATAVGFNMDFDLAIVLGVFAILADGDIATESFYLGSGPDGVGGLNRHSTVEADISPTREDFYTGCGDNHHLSSRLFKQAVGLVSSSSSKQFDLDVMAKQYSLTASFSKNYNPFLYYFPFPSIVSLGAFAFYPNFFSNGTYGLGGVANYESISSIVGAKLDKETGEFEYVPEQWPENWYRRSYPYGAVQALTQAFLSIYPDNPVGMPIGQLGTPNFNVTNIFCDIYQGVNSIVPLFLSGTEQEIESAVTWVASKLDLAFADTLLGCPSDTYSNNLFPNASQEGGALNPPPSVQSNVGNNVYNKIYFTATPTSPICKHTTNP